MVIRRQNWHLMLMTGVVWFSVRVRLWDLTVRPQWRWCVTRWTSFTKYNAGPVQVTRWNPAPGSSRRQSC